MLWLSQIEKSYGPQILFSNVDLQVKPKQRIGLIGPNGAGKTTLLNIIVGKIDSDKGEITKIKDLTIGYLQQDISLISQYSVRQEASKGLERIWAVKRELDDLAMRLANDTNLLDEFGTLQAKFEQMGGFEAEAKVEQILCGLGFHASALDRPCQELSGGWQMRVILAKLLLQNPHILLLDEPTNHLDLESVNWLEHFLQSFEGTIILISHDRWFLNRICTHIAELSQDGIDFYTGNFDAYLNQLEQQREILDKQRKNQARKLADLEKFIERFRYKSTKAKQVQSRLKMLEKMQDIEEIEDKESIHFKLPEPPKSGRVVLTLENIHQGYKNLKIYEGLNITIERGQHIALVGPNGAGKSTLLKILAGVVDYERGVRELGHLVKTYYFAQHQAEALHLHSTVLQEAMADTLENNPTAIRNILGAFLFDEEDVKKQISVLSGGEKNRLALVKMLLTPANVLLLDEPTNHLDMSSRAVLADAIRGYQGTVILISHDRQFIEDTCDEIWEVKNGRVTPYYCRYEEYLQKSQSTQKPAPFPLYQESSKHHHPKQATQEEAVLITHQEDRKAEKRKQAELRQEKSKRLKPFKDALEKAELKVSELEAQKSILDQEQLDPNHYQNQERVLKVVQLLKEINKNLNIAYEVWENAQMQLDEEEQKFEANE
jgi:ATP-binding cassette subfamily F protein 3